MGIFDFLKSKKDEPELFTGGSGNTCENAIIINTTSYSAGVASEYLFIEKQCGKRDVDWELIVQMSKSENNREYDLLEVELKKGGEREFWFDITSFYGKY